MLLYSLHINFLFPNVQFCYLEGILRIDIGGKALTNHLKDIISYRQLNVLDETFVMNQCKEDCCYVSKNLIDDLNICKQKGNSISLDYVLPDFTNIKRGFVRSTMDIEQNLTDQQMIKLNNERIQVPELLFNPADIGVNQIGLSHAIIHSIESLPEEYRPHLYENILLIGGNACFPGYRDRVFNDVRSMVDSFYDVNIYASKQPITNSWLGGKLLAENEALLKKLSISKKDYEQNGIQFCLEQLER